MINEGSLNDALDRIDTSLPILIAGPTASGKSALATGIAARTGGPIINADAMQVFADWRILTARPSAEAEARVPHALYGHVPGHLEYSVGRWLRDLAPLLEGPAPVIVGGSGLYFTALTEGLAPIPEIPDEVRRIATKRIAADGINGLLGELDPETRARIDGRNPMRVQRAWEVLTATGRGLAAWQDETAPPLLPLSGAAAILVDAPKDWLNDRIEGRFARMLADGLLDEVRENAPAWHPARPSAKAIGAAELIAHVRGETSLDDARKAAIVATRQFAKRQRSWFRSRMAGWQKMRPLSGMSSSA
ncbi:MAG: tRNA (adenosine(37)-N6)-dimethylallyltransferase MiaA [Boseongicola sp. SB0677_bin_26]|nr:tRNA (adenosine(37)-N6)-dimethylallyltransferase MiaA [Boseongicola sp. SB0665_bin_10]MYG24420.1 tRNA (adenosine(37)-N6)-dimethylallyltransferase MiaA [Boseongicola sp. SB0677_bin_26]